MTAWDVIGSDRLVRLVGGRSVYRDAYYIGERDDENTVQLARFIPDDVGLPPIIRRVHPDTPVEYVTEKQARNPPRPGQPQQARAWSPKGNRS
jgi:hypothetical protein